METIPILPLHDAVRALALPASPDSWNVEQLLLIRNLDRTPFGSTRIAAGFVLSTWPLEYAPSKLARFCGKSHWRRVAGILFSADCVSRIFRVYCCLYVSSERVLNGQGTLYLP